MQHPFDDHLNLTTEDFEEFSSVFSLYSKDNDVVDVRHLRRMLRAMGFVPKKESLTRVFSDCGFNYGDTRTLSRIAFDKIMVYLTNERKMYMVISEAFDLFDIDGTGFITLDNLRKASKKYGDSLRGREMEQMIKVGDRNNDGVVDFEEFTRLVGLAKKLIAETNAF